MDAREFIKTLVDRESKNETKASLDKKFLRFDHIFMNLPMDSCEFCDVFRGLFNNCDPEIWQKEGESEITLPLVHVSGFTYFDSKAEAL